MLWFCLFAVCYSVGSKTIVNQFLESQTATEYDSSDIIMS